MNKITFKDVAVMFNTLQAEKYPVEEIMEMYIGSQGVTYKTISLMFKELQDKGYTIEEIMTMPIVVGSKEVTNENN